MMSDKYAAKPFRADGGDISSGRIKEIADNVYGDEEKLWLAKRVLTLLAERDADKARIAELEETADLQRDKIKRLESDLWDEQQLRKVHSQKSFEMENENRELKLRNDKDFVWRGEEISRLNDELDTLKEKCAEAGISLKIEGE